MRPITALLVDDSRCFLQALAEYLPDVSQGAVVVAGSVSDSRDLLPRAAATQPEVVLLDYKLPDVSGPSILPRLRAQVPQALLMVVTLHDREEDRNAALAMGADAFVSKATIDHDLWPTMQRLVSARRGATGAA